MGMKCGHVQVVHPKISPGLIPGRPRREENGAFGHGSYNGNLSESFVSLF